MRILGLDMGSKTIGVALSDPLGWTAQGITTIRRTKKEHDLEEIHKICNEYGVETIVVGSVSYTHLTLPTICSV